MKIVPSQRLGKLGSDEGAPVLVRWRWYHYVPSLSLWGLVLVLLLGRKANRSPQAWLILIPLLLVVGLWQMPMRLLSVPSSSAEQFGFLITTGAIGWTAVWLVGDRLGGRRRFSVFMLSLAVMFVIGVWSYVAHFGIAYEGMRPRLLVILGAIPVLALVLGMEVSGACCRRRYRPGRFMGWLLVWMLVACALSLSIYASIVVANEPLLQDRLLRTLIEVLVVSLFLTGILYVLNLPFMILAFMSPFYSARFRELFRLREAFELGAPVKPVRGEPPISTDPTLKPVHLNDVVGPWQFYLDELARTVTVDFRPDGTFGQTIAANQGEATACAGGTWRLEGPEVHLTGYVSARSGSSQSRTWWMVDTSDGLALFGGDDGDWRFRMTRGSRPASTQAGGELK